MATFYGGRSIAVDGLNETIRGFKEINRDVPKDVRVELKRRTERTVLPAARRNWRSQRIKPSLADSAVVAAAGQTWAGIRVRYNDHRFPFGAGVVFGSWKYRQFRPWKGNQYTGNTTWDDYIAGPAIRGDGDLFAKGLMDDLAKTVYRGFTR